MVDMGDMGKMGSRSDIGDMDRGYRGDTGLTCRDASAFKTRPSALGMSDPVMES